MELLISAAYMAKLFRIFGINEHFGKNFQNKLCRKPTFQSFPLLLHLATLYNVIILSKCLITVEINKSSYVSVVNSVLSLIIWYSVSLKGEDFHYITKGIKTRLPQNKIPRLYLTFLSIIALLVCILIPLILAWICVTLYSANYALNYGFFLVLWLHFI